MGTEFSGSQSQIRGGGRKHFERQSQGGPLKLNDTPRMNECKFSLQSSFFSLKYQENGTVLTNTWKWEWNWFWIPK